jgi:S-DNA-T family DNA segregation ATPase FtsK/SpoIIIE
MARKESGHQPFLPAGSAEAIGQLAARLAGLTLAGAGAATAGALITFHASDPSFDTVTNGPVANVLGRFGANIADLFFQIWGLAIVLPVAVAMIWGLRILVTARPPSRWRWRLAALGGAVLGWTVAAAPLPVAGALPAGPGGAFGHLIEAALAGLMTTASASLPGWLPALAAAVIALVLSVPALGLSASEWRRLGRGPMTVTAAAGGGALALGRMTVELSRRAPAVHFDEEGAEPNPLDTLDTKDDEDRDEAPQIARAARPPAEEPAVETGPLVEPRRPPPMAGKRERAARQGSLDLGNPPAAGYELPPLTLLALPPDRGPVQLSRDALEQNAKLLVSVLEDFGVSGKVIKVRPGPVVTLYELEPAPGTKTSRVIGLADDIARSMSALSVRIATIPGRSVIGIELPNQRRDIVFLRELLASEEFERASARLTLVLGKDIGGAPVMVDLARMPHLLIAGTTGSGKSVAVNTMILSLLYRLPPEECRLIMIDPKMLELSVYDGIPHLLAPVVTEPGKAVVALKWAVREMEDRYRAMSQLGVRNITGYNQRLAEAASRGDILTRTVQTGFDPETGKPVYEDQTLALTPLPFIVVIVDEMADLMLVAGKDIEAAVQRLAQMARAAGIHLIMATQRPSVDVITGTIKANFPTRISFQVTSKIDSRTILGEQGAEQLLGQGDMLYMAAGGRIIRVHGPFVADDEVEKVVEHLRAQGEPSYIEAVTEEEDAPMSGEGGGGSGDDLYDQAVALVARENKASTSFIQRHLQIGYNRAARLIDRMEAEGVVGKPNHVGKREILIRGGGDY